ncbi:hypothetical protein [Thalassospira sp.]|uniref:hypothetical protein n=1 Tax=Thalassospira sp. TaxID=1912094 RepID=UPI003AA950D7
MSKTNIQAASAHETDKAVLGVAKDPENVTKIMTRLIDLLDVEWRLLEQAQYEVLPDITAEKNLLQKELQVELNAQRKAGVKDGNPHAGMIVDFEMVKALRTKLDRNNVRLQAKRDACLKRIRAGWAATAGDSSTSYDSQGDLRDKAHQKIISMKM